MKSSQLNYLKIGFSKISFEGKEKKHMDFENGPRRVAMQNGVMHVARGVIVSTLPSFGLVGRPSSELESSNSEIFCLKLEPRTCSLHVGPTKVIW